MILSVPALALLVLVGSSQVPQTQAQESRAQRIEARSPGLGRAGPAPRSQTTPGQTAAEQPVSGQAAAGQAGPGQAAGDRAAAVRRVAATVRLAAQEYRAGVQDGRVTAQAEVDEARLFLSEARRTAALLPLEARGPIGDWIDRLVRLVDATAPPDTVEAGARALAAGLAERFGLSLDEIPAQPPSLARGAQVYREQCAGCHGALGRGDGPLARGLDPRPADLSDRAALRDASPLDFYRRVTIGVAGTAMPAFEARLSADDRWAAAVYATLLRLPAPAGDSVPPALRAFPTTARMTDAQVLAALGQRDSSPAALARLAAVRGVQLEPDATATGRIFARVRAQLDSALALARAGQRGPAGAKAFDAYMTFEQVERSVRAKNPALAAALEAAFAELRGRAAAGAAPSELERIRRGLAADLENAERVTGETLSPGNLFVQSFVILVREGLEAILVIGALVAFLAKTGAAHRKRDIHAGAAAAVGASVLTALALETVFRLTPAKREALEGITMVAAAAVLFYVSYWLLSKIDVARWNRFVKGKVQHALGSGSALALASAAFLAVYREGFETVLFYKALFVAAGTGGPTAAILAGMGLGGALMIGVYVGINRFGVRLPLRAFFAVTSGFLYYMAFVFAGRGVAELQEGGLVSTTVVSWAPRLPAVGVYPTAESLAAQGILLLLLVAALVWTFLIEPRRLRVTSVLAPDAPGPRPARPPAGPGSPGEPAAGRPPLEPLVRSLERMQADLAQLRSEVERMRGYLAEARSNGPRRDR